MYEEIYNRAEKVRQMVLKSHYFREQVIMPWLVYREPMVICEHKAPVSEEAMEYLIEQAYKKYEIKLRFWYAPSLGDQVESQQPVP